MALDKVRFAGEFAEDVIISMVDAIMSAAVDFIQTYRKKMAENVLNSIY